MLLKLQSKKIYISFCRKQKKYNENTTSFAVMIVLSSCDNTLLHSEEVIEQGVSNEASSSKTLTDSTSVEKFFEKQTRSASQENLPSGWIEMFSDHPDGLRCFGRIDTKGRTWIVFKAYLPKIKISPVYRIHSSSSKNTKNPTFYKQAVRDWYESSEGAGSLASVNANYFNLDSRKLIAVNPVGYGLKGDRAELAHALGHDNRYISYGYSPTESGVCHFHTYNGKAYISNSAPTRNFELLVGGYHPTVDKDKNDDKGRTMIGIPYNGSNIVYIFCTGAQGGAKQSEVVSALNSFGCSKIIMLDGSGSSQATWDKYFRLVSSEDPLLNRDVPVVLRMDHR